MSESAAPKLGVQSLAGRLVSALQQIGFHRTEAEEHVEQIYRLIGLAAIEQLSAWEDARNAVAAGALAQMGGDADYNSSLAAETADRALHTLAEYLDAVSSCLSEEERRRFWQALT